jgi:Zn finger protein HypA/HybF involved in hydrogenase expression
MTKFTDQYKDSRWQKKRLEIMERDKFTCQSCGKSEDVTLNVHHAYYEKDRKVWEYPNHTLITWCEQCHATRHKLQKYILQDVSKLDKKCHKALVLFLTCNDPKDVLKAIYEHESIPMKQVACCIKALGEAYEIGAGDLSDGE